MDEILVPMDEAARRLGCTRQHLYRFIASGDLASVLLGRSRKIPVRALEEFVERLRAQEAGTE